MMVVGAGLFRAIVEQGASLATFGITIVRQTGAAQFADNIDNTDKYNNPDTYPLEDCVRFGAHNFDLIAG